MIRKKYDEGDRTNVCIIHIAADVSSLFVLATTSSRSNFATDIAECIDDGLFCRSHAMQPSRSIIACSQKQLLDVPLHILAELHLIERMPELQTPPCKCSTGLDYDSVAKVNTIRRKHSLQQYIRKRVSNAYVHSGSSRKNNLVRNRMCIRDTPLLRSRLRDESRNLLLD